mmetsp:Transcript_7926/g.23371  ORF Transcript_7926/g.23371 Transcript_7926/m.23371 type:complete len:267 (-) Transcript_7926:665-1465(-)
MHTVVSRPAATCRTNSGSAHKSTLFQTVTIGRWMSSSSRMLHTVSVWAAALGELTSTTCSSRLASPISSRVARNAATSCVGSFWMNPTVSVRSACLPEVSSILRVVGSRVANRVSSAHTDWLWVMRFSRVLLPLLVYPHRPTTGTMPCDRRTLCCLRCFLTSSSSFRSRAMRLRRMRLSTSICFSPMPLLRPPPWRSKWDHMRVSLGSWYSDIASSTCSCPSRVAARWPKMSRMRAVRSASRTSSPSTFSSDRCCPGDSSSSKITV